MMEFPRWLSRDINEQVEEDYYKILACSPDARLEDIQKQYRKLALQYHPDKVHAEEGDSLSGSFIYFIILVFLIETKFHNE
jgi:hypothetical protein